MCESSAGGGPTSLPESVVPELVWATTALSARACSLSDVALAEAARDVLALMQVAEAAAVALTSEALARGLVERSTAAGAAQWVGRLAEGEPAAEVIGRAALHARGPLVPPLAPQATSGDADAANGAGGVRADGADRAGSIRVPGIEPAQARKIATVAEALRYSTNQVLREALACGSVGVPGAWTALAQVEKVSAVLPGATRDEVFGHFLALPPGAGSRMISELTRRLVATYGSPTALDDEEERLARHESLSFSRLPGGMVRLSADLSPDHAEVMKHAVQALSAPAPTSAPAACCEDPNHRHAPPPVSGARDERSPGKRRADALMLLITTGAQCLDDDGQVLSSGSARIVVTVDHEVLLGRLRGAGVDEAGAAMSASTVRRLACDAQIIPMVLGSRSEPLDVGRSKRLVDKGLRRAVIHRDRHCTFPGCDRPPSWCQVHHVQPWWLGGATSLANSALLCQRHHTVVHRDGLGARVELTGVTWDLRPGQLPGTRHPEAAA